MTKDDILRILMNGATKHQDDLNDYTKGKSNGMAEAYSHAWTLVKKLNIDDVSKCECGETKDLITVCEDCTYKMVSEGN